MTKAVGILFVLVSSACQARENNPEPVPTVSVTTSTTELTTTTTEAVPEPMTTTEPEDEPTVEIRRPTPTSPLSTAQYFREQATTVPPARSSSSTLASIRACESGNDYSTDTGNGYYGAYQFAWGTWASVGGSGNPALASPAEQDMRAQMMLDAGRRGEWPNC